MTIPISALGYSHWLSYDWVALSQSLIPSLLGFSQGTYSILFSIITVRLRKYMAETPGKSGASTLQQVNATFFHFILSR